MFRTGFVTVMLLLGTVAVATADFCIQFKGFTLVGKGFSLPGKGACRDFRGFIEGTSPDTYWLNGQACGSSDGTAITFSLFANSPGSFALEGWAFSLDRGTPSGSGQRCFADVGQGAGDCESITVTRVTCSPSTVPIPPN